jgi:hypothetical protein
MHHSPSSSAKEVAMGTRKLIGIRTVLLVVVVSAGGVLCASAEPIVYFNLSYITGDASISQNGAPVVSNAYNSGQTLPNTGTWTINDGVAVSQLGASAASSGFLNISVTPNLFTGSGRSSSSAGSADTSGNIVGEASSVTLFGVLFQVTEPTVYDYAAHFVGTGFTEGVLWPIDPVSGLPRAAALIYDSFGGLDSFDQTLTHSGILAPGSYAFHTLAGTRPTFSSPQQTSAFDSVTFALTAAAPVPEPAAMLLVGTGLIASVRLLRGRRYPKR